MSLDAFGPDYKFGIETSPLDKMMLDWYAEIGITRGPVFRMSNGTRARQSQVNFSIFHRLVQVAEEKPSLFPDKRVDI
jgi:hypothetical protein